MAFFQRNIAQHAQIWVSGNRKRDNKVRFLHHMKPTIAFQNGPGWNNGKSVKISLTASEEQGWHSSRMTGPRTVEPRSPGILWLSRGYTGRGR